ncbi:hypothetical protein GJ744_005734 [Endocarpon pusillum]|uniref:Uncharacterized protein n=1 Tax=Endocarpon pusillum TaxID=364733 RepID=A0A8H7AP13_9EURO|nr:hypothetical protein GJ744_005734 [Endocarpon pusillum]
MAIVCAAAPTWRPLSRRLTEIARSHWSSLRSSEPYYDVEAKGKSNSHKSSQSGHSEHDHNHMELPPVPPIPQGTQHTVYDARLIGANQSHVEAYRDPLIAEAPSEESYGTSTGQNRGIQVQREVTVEDDRNGS